MSRQCYTFRLASRDLSRMAVGKQRECAPVLSGSFGGRASLGGAGANSEPWGEGRNGPKMMLLSR